MMQALQDALYLLSNALLVPALLLILVLTAWTISMVGGMIREWLARRSVRRALHQARQTLRSNELEAPQRAWDGLLACPYGIPARLARHLGGWKHDARERAKCLEDVESEVAVALSKLAWVTRIAPMLGLMGTLIPLGPALTGLASGNLGMLASNLVVAFTATVMGVFLGCTAYTMNLVRKNWYNRDMSDLEYVLSRLDEPLAP